MRAQEFTPKKLVIFDIDDTLVHTQTKVQVVKDGQVVNSLNSHDFTHYKLQPGESFDFENFRNAHDFFHNSKPIIPMMNRLKKDIATGNKVVMVTARADFDDRELFLDTFRKYGVDMSRVHVYRAGNMAGKIQTEEKKKIIIRKLLNQGQYTKAIMYDDAVPNLESFVELKDEYPQTKFYAWHVSLEGQASEYHRTNEDQSLEERKMKRKVRKAAYGPGPFGGYGYATGYSGDGGGDAGTEDYDPNDRPPGPETPPTMPAGTVRVDVSDTYDWYKLGQHISNLKGLGKHDFGKGPPSTIMSFGSEPEEHKYIKALKKTGLTTTDIDPLDPNQPKGMPRQKVDPTYNVGENFADGKNPQDKGDSKRHGINTKASVSSLRKTAKQGGRKGQLAHWLANMKSGRAKK